MRKLREEEGQLKQGYAEPLREMYEAGQKREEIIRERQQVEAEVTELGSLLAAYKREAGNCETSSREYRREAEDKRREAGRLQEEARRLQAQAQQF